MSIEVSVTQKCDAIDCENSRALDARTGGAHGTNITVAQGTESGWRFVSDKGWLCPETLRKIFGR